MKFISLIFSFFLFTLVCFGQEDSKLDSLKIEVESSTTDSALIFNLYQLNRYYRSIDSLQKALKIGEQMLEVANRMDETPKITWATRVISYNYYLLDSTEKSEKILQDYLKTLTPKDTADLAIINQDIGSRHRWREDYTTALKYYFKSQHYYELLGKPLLGLGSISSTYSRLNDEASATKYNLKYIELAKKDSNYWALAGAYLDQSYYYLMLIKHDSAYDYCHKAITIYRDTLKEPFAGGLGTTYGNLADVYIYYYKNYPDSVKIVNPLFEQFKSEKRYKKAIIDTAKYYIDLSYEIVKKNGNRPQNVFYIYYGYGDLNYYQGKIKASEKDFLKCYQLTEENEGMIFDRKKVSEQLYKVYTKLNNPKEALKYYEEFVMLRDSLFDKEKQREVGKQEAKFEFEKQKAKEEALRAQQKAIEDARIEQEKAVAREREKNQRFVTYAIAFGLLLISIFTLVIFKRLKIAKEQQALIKEQKKTIEKNRNQMLDSIEYSKSIQQRIFLTYDELKALLPNSFLYFRPKDVVSGDFYWAHKKGSKVYFSVADCTGHGVPGAFMTLISLNLINAIILEDIKDTADLLERLHVKLKERLTSSEEEQMKHGLDIAMCSYDYETGILEFSGLHNPLYIINAENELREIKGDNLFLGISSNFEVTCHHINIEKGDTVYMSTDGFPDQKGGEKGKKYYYSRFRNTLRVVNTKPLEERALYLDKKFNDWKGDREQIDDVCVMGVSF